MLGLPLGVAAQPKRVVVESFSGPQAGRHRAALLANLQEQDDIQVIEQADLDAIMHEAGVRALSTTDDYVRVAEAARIAAFIDGRAARRPRAWALTVRVRNGATGEILGVSSWSGRTMSALGSIRRNGYQNLKEYLDQASFPTHQAAPVEQTHDEERIIAVDHERPDEARDRHTEEPPSAPADYETMRVSLLFGFQHRSMTANASVYNRNRDPSQPADLLAEEERSYTSGGLGHSEAGLELELYPSLLFGYDALQYLGLVGRFTHSLFLASFGCPPGENAYEACADADRVEVPTDEYEIYVGARGRYKFGHAQKALELFADAGYGFFAFEPSVGQLAKLQLPSVIAPMAYSYIELGGGASYDIVEHYLELQLRGAYRLGIGIGQDTRAVWGVDTQPGNGFELSAQARTEFSYLLPGLFAGLRFDFFQFTTTFRGQTACADPSNCKGDDSRTGTVTREPDPWEQWPANPPGSEDAADITGGIQDPVNDTYWRLGLLLGYEF